MKNNILTLLAIMASVSVSYSQSVNNVPLSEITTEYVQIVGTAKLFSQKVKIDIDFGQITSMWTNKDTKIIDKDGTRLELNSMIDALNFMDSNGYAFVAAYVITIGNQNVYHYLMRKKNPLQLLNK